MSDLPVLPDVNFVETDAQQIIDDIISGYQEIAGRTLGQADPVRLYLLTLAYIIINQRNLINESGKSNLLYYAQGDFLDHIALSRDVTRLEATASLTTLRFTLSGAQLTNIGIPQGTRATADNKLYWRTTAPATIVAGQLYVDVPAEAMTSGVAANGLAIGTITRIVDPIPYVQAVTNTTLTSGGRDRESDEALRLRIFEAPQAFSIAGPELAYVFWARTASVAISDVAAYSPTPGVVEIRPLLQDGQIPGQDILDAVDAVLSPKTIRPLTDKVNVLAPETASYDLNFTYFIRANDGTSEAIIIDRVNQAVTDYRAWQRAKLGRDINPDELITLVKQAGAKRLAIVSPTYTVLDKYQIAQAANINVVYGGLEDD